MRARRLRPLKGIRIWPSCCDLLLALPLLLLGAGRLPSLPPPPLEGCGRSSGRCARCVSVAGSGCRLCERAIDKIIVWAILHGLTLHTSHATCTTHPAGAAPNHRGSHSSGLCIGLHNVESIRGRVRRQQISGAPRIYSVTASSSSAPLLTTDVVRRPTASMGTADKGALHLGQIAPVDPDPDPPPPCFGVSGLEPKPK